MSQTLFAHIIQNSFRLSYIFLIAFICPYAHSSKSTRTVRDRMTFTHILSPCDTMVISIWISWMCDNALNVCPIKVEATHSIHTSPLSPQTHFVFGLVIIRTITALCDYSIQIDMKCISKQWKSIANCEYVWFWNFERAHRTCVSHLEAALNWVSVARLTIIHYAQPIWVASHSANPLWHFKCEMCFPKTSLLHLLHYMCQRVWIGTLSMCISHGKENHNNYAFIINIIIIGYNLFQFRPNQWAGGSCGCAYMFVETNTSDKS